MYYRGLYYNKFIMEWLKNTPNALKATLRKNHKVSFHWNKAKIIEINDLWLKIKYDESWLISDISNDEIENWELNVINKNNIKAQEIIEIIKSKVELQIKKEA
jgi:hypothetical protein